MKWTWEVYQELYDASDALAALEYNWYDTHNLDYILENKNEYEATVERLTKELPVEGSTYGDYDWDFENNELRYLW